MYDKNVTHGETRAHASLQKSQETSAYLNSSKYGTAFAESKIEHER
jgi:hypothetical protein